MGYATTRRRLSPRLPRAVAIVLLGVVIGLSAAWLGEMTRFLNYRCVENQLLEPEPQLILIGIMTAAKYVDTRAYTVWRTWAQSIPGRVLFFVAENTQSIHADMPLVRLKGVDDTYPPQKKSFAMLRWMADRQLNSYYWFMRADDDLYVRGDRLERLLRSLDPEKAQLLGQAGLGNTAEYGQLSLGQQDNYCMGGPGVVMSRETLRAVRPHLRECLSQLLTSHEDVELGRCIRKHVGVPCTWNYEMHMLFHNNQTTMTAYTGTLDELRHAVTLHPIKRPAVMRRVHIAAQSLRLNALRAERVRIARDLPNAPAPSLTRHVSQTPADLKPWNFISSSNILFCVDEVNCPRHTVPLSSRTAITDVIRQLFEQFNANARARGRVLQFQSIQYGYMRVEPSYGVDYVLDMILWFKKFRGPRRTTISVRRHAYVQQTFGAAQCIDDTRWRAMMQKHAAARQLSLDDPDFPDNRDASQAGSSVGREPSINGNVQIESSSPSLSAVIHIILPLSGRVDTFRRFATHLRNICTNRDRLALVVVMFASAPADDANIRTMIAELSEHVRVQVVDMGNAEFSRGVALTRGAATLAPDALMFFTDVDMLFTCDALDRIRLNTVHDAQVYFPIVFSEYSPETWSDNDRLMVDAFHYGRRRGYFRHFGFGLVSLYKSDLDLVGGLATNIHGWGLEDVDLFDKCVKSRLRVIRAPDPGLVHIYHPVNCPAGMPATQREMCIGSKAASLASLDSLADQISLYP